MSLLLDNGAETLLSVRNVLKILESSVVKHCCPLLVTFLKFIYLYELEE